MFLAETLRFLLCLPPRYQKRIHKPSSIVAYMEILSYKFDIILLTEICNSNVNHLINVLPDCQFDYSSPPSDVVVLVFIIKMYLIYVRYKNKLLPSA